MPTRKAVLHINNLPHPLLVAPAILAAQLPLGLRSVILYRSRSLRLFAKMIDFEAAYGGPMQTLAADIYRVSVMLDFCDLAYPPLTGGILPIGSHKR